MKMGRKKVKLQLIENQISRKTTYTKRMRGILRKTQELSVLCGVEVCVVIYGPYNEAPVVWPSGEAEAKRIINEFRRRPEMDKSLKQFDQVAFMKDRLAKANEKLSRIQKKNREMELENIVTDIFIGKLKPEDVPKTDLGELLWLLEGKLCCIDQRCAVASSLGLPQLPPPPTPPHEGVEPPFVPPPDVVVGGGVGLNDVDLSFSDEDDDDDDDYGLGAIVKSYFSIPQTQTQTQAGSSKNESV